MGSLKQYTLEEVEKSNNKQRTVLAVHDKVYDVTGFLNEHPGGEEILLDHGGKDATEDFADVGHSTDALDLMKKYLVGEIVEAERRKIPEKKGWTAGVDTSIKSKTEKSNNFLPMFAVIGLIAAGLYTLIYVVL